MMTPEELMLTAVIGLPERVYKLERALFEHRIILRMLLSRAGLDEAGVERAFELAKESVDRYSEERMERTSREWLATPEGQEAKRQADAPLRAREKELWRDECLEDGRIYADPTKKPPE